MYLGMYKDCINQQKQLERKESDEEEELLMDTEKQTRKRKRKLIKVYMCTIFDRTYIIFTYRVTMIISRRIRNWYVV